MHSLQILGINIARLDYRSLVDIIAQSIRGKNSIRISYVNANTANLAAKNSGFKEKLNSFDIVHPDGFGIYMASKILFKKEHLPLRFTGSDFYPLLANEAVKNKWKIFFFGHSKEILDKIKPQYPSMNICGYAEGYRFNPVKIANQINNQNPDILIVGLGQPLQEELIQFYRNDIKCRVIIAVGDGIRVFAGEKKRGPVFMQRLGMEWLVRLMLSPAKYFKRYVIGNPLFLYKIIIAKIRKFRG